MRLLAASAENWPPATSERTTLSTLFSVGSCVRSASRRTSSPALRKRYESAVAIGVASHRASKSTALATAPKLTGAPKNDRNKDRLRGRSNANVTCSRRKSGPHNARSTLVSDGQRAEGQLVGARHRRLNDFVAETRCTVMATHHRCCTLIMNMEMRCNAASPRSTVAEFAAR